MGGAEQAQARPTVVVEVRGPIGPVAVRVLCERVAALLLGNEGPRVICEVSGVVDIGVVDTIARLALLVRRGTGAELQITGRDPSELLAFAGLRGVVGVGLERWAPGLEVPREAEAGEQRRVEEVVQMRDLPA